MKATIIAGALFTFTVIGIAVFPSYQQAQAINLDPVERAQQNHRIEVVFILDTTSSMSGLIEAAKEKIWSIASTMASAQQAPQIKMGLVAFRDRGDAYVTRVLDLSEDLDTMYAQLMDLRAEGGGDGPESVNQALFDAVHKVSWSADPAVYRVAFLIGDAPPHMDYSGDVAYQATLRIAQSKGIVVNAIQSGQHRNTTPIWQDIAELGDGAYFQVEDSGNAVAVITPYDRKLSELAASLEQTRLYYGDKEQRLRQQQKLDASAKLRDESSAAALARRATFNATSSGAANFLGESELVDAVTSGRVRLEQIDADQLPKSLQSLAPEQQLTIITEQANRREALKQEIRQLSATRNDYIAEEIEAQGGARDSLDERIYSAVKKQAGAIGLVYEKDSASY